MFPFFANPIFYVFTVNQDPLDPKFDLEAFFNGLMEQK